MHTPFKPDDESNEQLEKAIWQDTALIQALQKADSQQKLNEPTAITPRKKSPLLVWGSAVAASLIMAFIGLTHLSDPATPQASTLVAAQQFFATKASDITLSDGTEVALNTQTDLQFNENDKTRQATLSKGEAYFSVKRDEQRPFTIKTGNATISVLGTAFNVDKTLRETTIDVFHGKVAVNTENNSKQVELVKGQRARVIDNNIVVTTFNATQPDWQLGWLDLENVTINDAIFQLNRYTDKPLVLNNVDAQLRVSGRFKTADVVGAATLIAQLNQLKINSFDDSVVLSPIE
ncbi:MULTISPECIES: FecR domain-containing protein [unclassified Pseudoalteromonas]|uniref:FecR family protein n=1 Tax=unclassified Pseudoalteromonas TaxID=194690 RepID=UPI0025B4A495|nr:MULTISPECIES: FecR domain-containing protein [unclassified Pseudoalteromonas]MDN3379556.1 FecR domain-containing protein [Pseudoalteromonas sp. APC 3893]MDN3387896.1 FecR domain-containing protein [Pseudoalteromonas sp. APC 4017]